MTAEPSDRGTRTRLEVHLVPEVDESTEELAIRAEAIRDRLLTQMGARLAEARAAEREKLSLELAEALGVADAPEALGWPTLTAMVEGVRAIGDLVLDDAAPEVEREDRHKLLVSFGVAEYWTRVRSMVEQHGPTYREALGLDDGPDAAGPARPMGDEGVPPGSPLEVELNASLRPSDPPEPDGGAPVVRP